MTELDSPVVSTPEVHSHAQVTQADVRPSSSRTAVASGRVVLDEDAFEMVRDNRISKGDVLTVANVAGVMGAKRTSLLLPLCHDVVLQNVELDFELDETHHAVVVKAIAKTQGPTGVEMEALTAVSIAALNIYDMCKSVSKDIMITDLHLLAKTGGISGDYRRSE
ncbi:MAG: cyclic pyranopterin monophosphate synthase MoaC [Rubricoccaceae bacterium]|nr:cyclic pyranopterin monophosphate synthase MoaC [Rubricoccaceae bacterium]